MGAKLRKTRTLFIVGYVSTFERISKLNRHRGNSFHRFRRVEESFALSVFYRLFLKTLSPFPSLGRLALKFEKAEVATQLGLSRSCADLLFLP